MNRSLLLWIIALMITAAAAVYQRVTGPTYPLSGELRLGDRVLAYEFPRSHAGPGDCRVSIRTDDPTVSGELWWKRYPSRDPWHVQQMVSADGMLSGKLPHQPPAGHLEYMVRLRKEDAHAVAPSGNAAVIRFKGEVPLFVLIPHVIAMFGAMLLSTRGGLESFLAVPRLRRLVLLTVGFLVIGGMVLGPIVQRFAFGAYWTGWPFGTDLTDNKTLLALLCWAVAAISVFRGKGRKFLVIIAASVTMIVYMIPHSVEGSKLDYEKDFLRLQQPPE